MNDRLTELIQLIVIIFVLGGTYLLVMEAIKTNIQYHQEVFLIWKKANPTSPLTYDEWEKLRSHNLINR